MQNGWLVPLNMSRSNETKTAGNARKDIIRRSREMAYVQTSYLQSRFSKMQISSRESLGNSYTCNLPKTSEQMHSLHNGVASIHKPGECVQGT